jgi:ATP-dependent RNA helicase RhlE
VIRALVLTPTRELALQIDECFADYGKYTGLVHTAVFGGVKQGPQVEKLKRGLDILIATPGRLMDLRGQGYINLENVSTFVLDEADRMLDMGFIVDIRRIISMLPTRRQTLYFSATMPDEIVRLSRNILTDPVRIEVTPASSTVDAVEQSIYFVEKPDKKALLVEILRDNADKTVLVFSRTKHGADNISKILSRAGIESAAIHGDKSQGARQKALSDFKAGHVKVMVATDIAARGIDIKELGMVINYDLPDVVDTYVHRIGRTGRAGAAGQAITFCSQDDHMMVKDIQALVGRPIHMELK